MIFNKMAQKLLDKSLGISKFKGGLVGALMGDCLGAPFENEDVRDDIQEYFDNLEEASFKSHVKRYTDDTAMTNGILESLIEKASFDERDIASRFVQNYFEEPNRGYGPGVITVFEKLKKPLAKGEDIWQPAKEQFNGMGSFGNGGAMRITPVALYCCSDYNLMLHTAEMCTRLTHANNEAIHGALLQAIAVQKSFFSDPEQPLDVESFVEDLIIKMTDITKSEETKSENYVSQLREVQHLLQEDNVDNDVVDELLGTNIRALYSVPTAIYCFLRAQRPIDTVKTENKFRRTLQYCISLGGDTDTIASMAGAMSGAYHGFEYINPVLMSRCEGVEKTIEQAEQLYNISPFHTQMMNQ